MNVQKLWQHKEYMNINGVMLTNEEVALAQASLTLLQNETHFLHMLYWGQLYALQGDYHIAVGVDANHAIDSRKYFYSTDLQSWGLLPKGKSKYKQLSLLTTTPFRGDPALKIKVLDESLDEGDSDRCRELIEEKRLAATVALISEETEVRARGELLKDPNGNVTINKNFYGLTLAEAKQLKSYLHVRTPINRWNTNLLTRPDYNYSFDFLDSVDMDIPSGCWNLSLEQSDSVAYLKNLYWPGMSYFHIIGTADAGFFYVGNGRKNLDVPFLL